jgi:predicted DNA binding CopG/RHH family protein
MTPDQTVRFVEDFRSLHRNAPGVKSRLISLKVPESLLAAFKTKARLKGVAYQTEIKRLMRDWTEK